MKKSICRHFSLCLKSCRSVGVAVIMAMFLAGQADAAVVGPAGYTNAIGNTAPATSDFSTLSVGADLAGTYTTAAALDAAVSNNTSAASITTALGTSGTVPPSANSIFRVNTGLSVIQSRPTGNEYSLLLCTLVNNSGTNATNIFISYDYAPYAVLAEEISGHRVFFSMTGAAQSWTNIAELSGLTVSNTVSVTVPVGVWPNGSTMYLLWADDNAASTDTGHTINNFFVQA